MNTTRRIANGVLAGSIALLLAACGGSGDSATPPATGTMKLSLTDAPVDDADAVWIQFSGVAFKPEGSAPEFVTTLTPSPRRLNLLEYQQGNTAVLLDNITLNAGRYEWIRLIIDNAPNVRDSYVELNGQECELRVPSGAESGLKLVRGFTLPASGSVALTIDFDLRQSLLAPPGLKGSGLECAQGYLLKPVLRLVEDSGVGAIAGSVTFAAGSVPAECRPKVYIYQGDVTPDDIEESTPADPDIDPLVTASVDLAEGAVVGTYRAAFIPAGEYTAAFSCSDDDPEDDDTLVFVPAEGESVTVQSNLISTVDFTVPAPTT